MMIEKVSNILQRGVYKLVPFLEKQTITVYQESFLKVHTF